MRNPLAIVVVVAVVALAALAVTFLQRSPAGDRPAPIRTQAPAEGPVAAQNPAAPGPSVPVEGAAEPAEGRRAAVTEGGDPRGAAEAPERAERGEARASTVTAIFVDGEGLPLPGVELSLERRVQGPPLADVRPSLSGAGGRAVLELEAGPGRTFAVFAWRAEGFRMGGLEAELVVGGATDLGTQTLLGGTPVSGRVVGPDDAPVEGARVWASEAALPDGDAGQLARHGPASIVHGLFEEDTTPAVTSAVDGTFRLPGVAPGEARLWAHAEGSRYSTSEPFDVPAAGEVRGIEVRLGPLLDEDCIEGVVLAEDGEPLPHATVRYALRDEGLGVSSSLEADDEGRFRLVVFRGVPHSFTVQDEESGGTAHAAAVAPGTLDLVLRLGQEDSYELLVTDTEGAPIESYRVTTNVGDERSWSGRSESGTEHPGGRARLGKPEASFWIEVNAVGYELGKAGPFDPASVPETVEVVLSSAPILSGRVLLEDGPAAGAVVQLLRETEDDERLEVNGYPAFWRNVGDWTRTAEDGGFQLMPREAGTFRVRVEHAGWAPSESDSIHLSEGQGASGLDVELTKGGTLVVQVVGGPGRDAAGVVVAATRGDGHPLTRRADADGRAVFEGLTPGRWNVLEAEEELEPFSTTSTFRDAEEGEPPAEHVWVVEVRAGATANATLVLRDDAGD